VRIIGAIEVGRHFERVQIRRRAHDRGVDLIFRPRLVAEHVEHLQRLGQRAFHAGDRVDVGAYLGEALHRRLGGLRVVPEPVAARALF
jgi:hypothetical protein